MHPVYTTHTIHNLTDRYPRDEVPFLPESVALGSDFEVIKLLPEQVFETFSAQAATDHLELTASI